MHRLFGRKKEEVPEDVPTLADAAGSMQKTDEDLDKKITAINRYCAPDLDLFRALANQSFFLSFFLSRYFPLPSSLFLLRRVVHSGTYSS